MATTTFCSLLVPALVASSAQAQDAAAAPKPDEIVVTGSLIRRANTKAPVTVVSQESLDARGISTIQDAVQQLASNNGPALPNSFTANGAFAGGASAASLRGLSTNSTLVLFDGLRAAYYPLADDGSRNFVDLNTVPDDIVARVEVLRDGASATYGADAIAGVVNIITKRSFNGLSVRAEKGLSGRNDAGSQRWAITGGVGDLDKDGINAYLSVSGYKSDMLKNSERGYPFNTDNLTSTCFDGTCGSNGIVNQNTDGTFALSTAANFMVRPYTVGALNALTAVPGGKWQSLSTSCGSGVKETLTTAQQGTTNPTTVCAYDYTNLYGVIQPKIERNSISGRVTAKLWEGAEGYAEFNFMQSNVSYTGFPASVVANAPTGIAYPRFSTSTFVNPALATGSYQLFLPVYVCPERVSCDTSINKKLNPYNPFAASGQVARLIGRDMESTVSNETRNRAYRLAGGFKGTFSDGWLNGWGYDVAATAMHTDLRRTQKGYIYIQHLLDVIADGTYNFANPSATPQSVLNYLKPTNVVPASSDVVHAQASLTGSLFALPGGDLKLAAGVSAEYEAVDAPSGNPDYNGPTQRYFTLNAFGTKGERRVYAGFFEIQAPVLDKLEIDVAGRYDSYSTGQSNFSPKVGVKYDPFKTLTLRGTFSKGFRIPAFGEANALPTTGYVSNTAGLFNNTYLAQYGCTVATFSSCPTYIRSGSYGQTTLASPNLEPEKSESFTTGFVWEPVSKLRIAVDYYNIKKTGAITQPSNAPALQAYYTGQPIPAGYTVIADAPDVNNPTALPRVAFVQSQLVNANTIKVSGVDVAVDYDKSLTSKVLLNSALTLSYIDNLSTEFPDGTVERYDGTAGNYNLTAGSGTPKWHGSWTNTFAWDIFKVSATVNYFSGYDLSAMDQGTGYKDCGLASGYIGCTVDDAISYDLTARAKLNNHLTLYANVLNVTDQMPPLESETYGAHLYNPVQGGNMILGRYFKLGIKYDF